MGTCHVCNRKNLLINDPDDAPDTIPGAEIMKDPNIAVDALVDDVYEPNSEGPDVVD